MPMKHRLLREQEILAVNRAARPHSLTWLRSGTGEGENYQIAFDSDRFFRKGKLRRCQRSAPKTSDAGFQLQGSLSPKPARLISHQQSEFEFF